MNAFILLLQKKKIFQRKSKDWIRIKLPRINGIPAKILVEKDIISPFVIYNDSKISLNYILALKLADITPTRNKGEASNNEKYRTVSILPSVSKIFERNMFEQIWNYIEKYLSPFLCDFPKGCSTQHCLTIMLEKWKRALDNGNIAGALLSDLLKAFDDLNHDLIIGKLHMALIIRLSLIFGTQRRKLLKLFNKTFFNLNIIFKPGKHFLNIISFKDKIPKHLLSRDIYQFKCTGCNCCYVGFAERHLLVVSQYIPI